MTSSFDLGCHGACGRCGSSFSIHIPSLKFVFAIRKTWRTTCVSINGPRDPDFWRFDLETGMRVASKVGNLPSKFGHARPLGSRIIRYVRDGRTDKSNAYCPFPTGSGHDKVCSVMLAAMFLIWQEGGFDRLMEIFHQSSVVVVIQFSARFTSILLISIWSQTKCSAGDDQPSSCVLVCGLSLESARTVLISTNML